ncbi:S24 family peptidase [Gemmobacter denitrificans]|uniref:S24 family peptidase n=1 Tax=Gemmobacter denitrificans TaxID=3123040 RepID=A0ABU8C171_9RHOB
MELYIGPPREIGPLPPAVDPSELASIPLHEAFLSAGSGVENASEHVVGHLAFRHDWLKRMHVTPSNAVLARAHGDSMQPCVWDGDVLLIDRARTEPPSAPKKGTAGRRPPIFALLDDGEAKVKRVQMHDNGSAALISDNPDYPPHFARIETLTIIGRVVWWGHTDRG